MQGRDDKSERPLRGLRGRRWLVRTLVFAVLLGGFAILLSLEPPSGLSERGWRALMLFVLTVTLWMSNLIPLAVTSLTAIGLIPLLHIMPADDTYAYFGSKVVFFIMGAFILGAALVGSGLSARLAMLAIDRFGRTPRRLVATIYFVGAIGSCLMSEHAVAAMLFPIALSITQNLDEDEASLRFGRALFLGLAWGCIVGGTTTMLGGGRGPLAVGILEEMTHHQVSIGFVEYVLLDLPLVLLLLAGGAVFLVLTRRLDEVDLRPARQRMHNRLAKRGRMSAQEFGVGAVMVVTIVLWVALGDRLGLANVAILATTFLFVTGLMNWRDVEEGVNWAILLMYGGAICLGAALHQSGASDWLIGPLRAADELDPRLLLMLLAVLSMALTEMMSNSAVIAVLLPVALEIGRARGIDLRIVTMTVVLPSNFAFAFPMSTPANALAYSSGYIPIRTMLFRGLRLNAVGLFGFAILLFLYWPLLGYRLGG